MGNARCLEGELYIYNGVIWVAKGYQHPEGFIIAYPKYLIEHIPSIKIPSWLKGKYIKEFYWSCINAAVPVIPLSKSMYFSTRLFGKAREMAKLISEYADIDLDENVYFTGSSSIGLNGDIDLVFYGNNVSRKVYDSLMILREAGVFKPLSLSELLEENKKNPWVSFSDYVTLRSKSVLQGSFMNVRYSIRLVPYEHGYNTCIDRVIKAREEFLKVKVIEALSPHTTPAMYRVVVEPYNYEALLSSFKILFTELKPGVVIEGTFRVEHREQFIKPILIPDAGKRLKFIEAK
ncbi:MAG: hypothetical protein QW398_02950 [Desulfurococcaceae archaeon]